MLVVAGAGLAGLVCAVRALELGLDVAVFERGDRPGGSMLLSSGVVWRHREWARFRAECPGGEPALQRLVWERLDEALAWLPVEPVRDESGERSVARRYDPRALTAALARPLGDRLRLRRAFPAAPRVVLASGGFAAALARPPVLLRGNPWSDGAGRRYAQERGAALTGGLDEFYGRLLPAPPARIGPAEWVDHAQVWGKHALVLDTRGALVADGGVSWHEAELVQAVARRPDAQAWLVADASALGEATPYGSVAEAAARAERAGGEVRRAGSLAALALPLPPSRRLREPPFLAVRVVAAVTHTIGGVRVDARARALDERGEAVPGLWAAGVDAGGVANGGYASGLAQALVLGLAAAEDAAHG